MGGWVSGWVSERSGERECEGVMTRGFVHEGVTKPIDRVSLSRHPPTHEGMTTPNGG